MANTRKDGVVDGFTALKAAQRASRSRPSAAVVASTPGAPPDELQKLGAQVRTGAVPTKQLIECYECGYRFQLHGRVPKTNCNKCRTTLDLTDHTISECWSGALKTAGAVRVTAVGIVESGAIVANDFILEGTVQAGIVKVMRRLELHSGARFSEHNIKAPDLLIAPGTTIALIEPAEYRDVEIAGALRANLHATGVVTVRPGGCLQGKIHTRHLVVEDGGGLQADLQIDPTGSKRK
jgi:cytoskeletal protein CcmA (bactofilin family)